MCKKLLGLVLIIVLSLSSIGPLIPEVKASESGDTAAAYVGGAVRTAGFNSGTEWLMGNYATGDWSGTDVLVAAGQTGWTVPSDTVFTDSDGTTVTMPSLSGSVFNTPRNAVVTFEIPRDQPAEYIRSVQLDFTIRNVKQVSAGARLAVFGNSLKQPWNSASGKTVFGADGANSGLDQLDLLGFTDSITVGSSTSEVVSGQTVSLTSNKLMEYVKDIAGDPDYTDGELSFRLAGPSLGGIRVYSEYAASKPTLRIYYSEEPLTYVPVTIKTVDGEGNTLRPDTTVQVMEGTEYSYSHEPAQVIKDDNGVFYRYNEEASVLSLDVIKGAANEILLVYDSLGEMEVYSGETVTEEGSWCWFADSRALHYANEDGSIDMTYIGYIDVHGAIKATQYNHNTNETEEVLIRSNFQPDDHNNPTFLVLPDGRVMVFYSRHTDESCFYYRVSREAGDITTFGKEKKLVTNHNTTYPTPFIMADDPDHIYLTWRGINWHPTLAKLSVPDENDEVSFTWGPKQVISSSAGSNVRPYAKYTSDGAGKIHMTYTATHPDNVDPNPIYYSYIDIADMSLRDMGGNKLTDLGSSPFAVSGNETNVNYVVDDRNTSKRGWVWEIALDGETPVIAMVRISSDKNSHDYYYAKWNGTNWTKTFLANAGGRFHSSNTEYCYSGGLALDKADPRSIYASVPVAGEFGRIYEIIKYDMSTDGRTVISETQMTENSVKNNVRPFIVKDADENGLKLLWMNGDYSYWIVNASYPAGYPTSIKTNYGLPKPDVDVTGDMLVEYDFQSVEGTVVRDTRNHYDAALEGSAEVEGGVLELTGSGDRIRIDGDIFGDAAMESFTISMHANILESNYVSGHNFKLFDFANGAFSMSVKDIASTDSMSFPGRLPVLTTSGQNGSLDIVSTNMLSNSDWYRTKSGTTDSSKNVNNMGWTHFAVTYDAETGGTKTFINGLLDTSGTSVKNMLNSIGGSGYSIGGFHGQISDVRIFSKALSPYEVTRVMNNIPAEPGYKYEAEIEKIKNALEITSADGETAVDPAAVTSNLNLPIRKYGENGETITITWESSDTDVIRTNGTVVRPFLNDSPVILKAVISGGGYSAAKEFTLTVKGLPADEVCTVSFDANGGSVEPDSMMVQPGGTLALPAPIRWGYNFTGWFTEREGGTQVTNQTSIQESMTLYAQWSNIWPYTSTASWASVDLGSGNTGNQTVEFIVTPLEAKQDGAMYFTGQNAMLSDWGHAPVALRLNTNGYFDARNGGAFEAVNQIAYESGQSYLVKIDVDLENEKYSVYITAPGGEQQLLAADFAFRTNAQTITDIGKFCARGGDGAAAGKFVIDDLTIRESSEPEVFHTVVFNANGGNVSPASMTVKSGETLVLPVPTRDHYNFTGWFTAETGGTQVTNETVITENMTLYARWIDEAAVTYTITFDANGGKVTPDSMTVEAGKSLALPIPTREHHKFEGWFTQKEGGTQVTNQTVFTGDTTIYARWTEEKTTTYYTVTFDANGGKVTPASMTAESGTTLKLPAPTREGYRFEGWFTAKTGGQQVTAQTAIDKDMKVYARWTAMPVQTGLRAGEVFTSGSFRYKVKTAAASGTGKAELLGFVKSNKTKSVAVKASVTAPATKETFQIVSIAAGAFKNNKTITKAAIGKNVTEIGKNAFANCKKLTKVTGMSKLTRIGASAFSGCKVLKKFTIGKSVTAVGSKAFYKCTRLSKITIKSAKLKKIGKKAITGISKKAVIKVPSKQIKTYKRLLKANTGYKKTMKIRK